MIPATIRTRFVQTVESELGLLERFHALLEREQALLIDGNTDGLIALTPQKTELHGLLQRQHDNLTLLLGQAGLPAAGASIAKLCADLPDTQNRWQRILELGAEVKQLNELNGKLILERMQHNQAALSILLAAADQPSLYDAEGAARPTGRGRHLGSA